MDGKKILGVLLLVGGLAALVYGHLSAALETHRAGFAPYAFSVAERTGSVIPTGATLRAVAAGAEPWIVGR